MNNLIQKQQRYLSQSQESIQFRETFVEIPENMNENENLVSQTRIDYKESNRESQKNIKHNKINSMNIINENQLNYQENTLNNEYEPHSTINNKNLRCFDIDFGMIDNFNNIDEKLQNLMQKEFVSNKIDLQNLIERNIDYFFHLMGKKEHIFYFEFFIHFSLFFFQGLCACVHCVCGKCPCKYHFGP